ncbi:NADH-quinone oxidoreductase subunit A [Limibacter armeniacum]|uniref:NADH-quinone oxidoreductase subunit A n=1 Tax=Limibacter armeniacum TaxID=466084 RepID=UPI002FE55DCE
MENSVVTDFGYLLLFIIAGCVFVGGGFVASSLLRPNRPNYEKLTTYESGEDPIGNAWSRFNIRFYVIALIFLLFEVELVFLFPWATVFGNKEMIDQTDGLWGWFALLEVFVFVLILVLGLAYVWRKGFLDWVRPEHKQSDFKSKVPASMYEQINKKY